MNMINVRRLTVMTFLGAGMLSGISAQVSPLQVDTLKETKFRLNGTCNRVSTMPLSRTSRFVRTGSLRPARRLM